MDKLSPYRTRRIRGWQLAAPRFSEGERILGLLSTGASRLESGVWRFTSCVFSHGLGRWAVCKHVKKCAFPLFRTSQLSQRCPTPSVTELPTSSLGAASLAAREKTPAQNPRLLQPYRDCTTCLRELPRPDTKLKETVSWARIGWERVGTAVGDSGGRGPSDETANSLGVSTRVYPVWGWGE